MAAITVAIHVAWWVKWYLSGVALMCRMTGMEPDLAKVSYWVERGIKIQGRSRNRWA